MIEHIIHEGTLYAILLRNGFNQPGVTFFTPGEYSQQLAFMLHPAGKVIEPHVHNPVPREVLHTLEVLLLKRGVLRVDFYDPHQKYLESRVMREGDTILLAAGGHGFEVLEEIEMIEVKQGPYANDSDKTRFKGIASHQASITDGDK